MTPRVMNRLILLAALACMVLSCRRVVEVDERIGDTLFVCQQKGASVEKASGGDGKYEFYFSDYSVLTLKEAKVYTIGLDGKMYLDGEPTDLEPGAVPTDFSDKVVAVEWYTDWTFYCDDGTVVKLPKSLFTTDADAVMRAVNHRGFNHEAPENTLAAFRLSRLNGFRYVETDVRFTADGVPVLLHDAAVDHTSDGSGNIAELTFAQARTLDFGSWKSPDFAGEPIPSLEEFLSLCRQIGLVPYIELKAGTKEQTGQIVQLVKQFGFEDEAIFISFSKQLLQYASEFNPKARLGFLCGEVSDNELAIAQSLGGTGFIDASDLSKNAADKCRQNNVPLEVWTVNSKDNILSLSDYISGVTSDLYHAGRIRSGAQ